MGCEAGKAERAAGPAPDRPPSSMHGSLPPSPAQANPPGQHPRGPHVSVLPDAQRQHQQRAPPPGWVAAQLRPEVAAHVCLLPAGVGAQHKVGCQLGRAAPAAGVAITAAAVAAASAAAAAICALDVCSRRRGATQQVCEAVGYGSVVEPSGQDVARRREPQRVRHDRRAGTAAAAAAATAAWATCCCCSACWHRPAGCEGIVPIHQRSAAVYHLLLLAQQPAGGCSGRGAGVGAQHARGGHSGLAAAPEPRANHPLHSGILTLRGGCTGGGSCCLQTPPGGRCPPPTGSQAPRRRPPAAAARTASPA